MGFGRWETLIKGAKDHVWVMTPQAMGHLSRIMADKLLERYKLRSIFCENIRETKVNLPSGKNVERKLLPEVPVIMIISENEASISFPRLDGNVDFPSFFGSDPSFLKWVNDLFLYYWEQAKIWHPYTMLIVGWWRLVSSKWLDQILIHTPKYKHLNVASLCNN